MLFPVVPAAKETEAAARNTAAVMVRVFIPIFSLICIIPFRATTIREWSGRKQEPVLQSIHTMKRLILFFLVAAALLAAGADYAAEGKLWWSHIQFLADDQLQGRDVGT